MSQGAAAGRESDVVARGPRICLRAKRRDDAIDDYAWRRDPELAKFDALGPMTLAFSSFAEQFERDLFFDDPTRKGFSIDTHGGEHIGNAMFYNGDHASSIVEFGITIGRPEFQGAGYGREVTVAFLRYIWRNLPFRAVYLHTLEWNGRARACFTAAGFEETALVLRRGHRFIRMDVRREWWLMWDAEGRFDPRPLPGGEPDAAPELSPSGSRAAFPVH